MFLRKRIIIDDIFKDPENFLNNKITICGWIHLIRKQGQMLFILLNDGSTSKHINIVFSPEYCSIEKYENFLNQAKKGSSIKIFGMFVKSIKENQDYEIQGIDGEIYGNVDASKYPISKNKMGLETIRENLHLRIRTQTIASVMRIRNTLAKETHNYFQSIGCKNVNTPILTTNDCEGAGECFTVTSQYPNDEKPKSLYRKNELFKKPVYLTVSGQLHGESYATALGDIYTFGPTFRAENSNTAKHLCEFWMIEPELSFINFNDLMDLSEDYVKYCISHVLKENIDDLILLQKTQKYNYNIIDSLKTIVQNKFIRVSYTDAIDILSNCDKTFEEKVEWGIDLSTEHERYLVEEHFKLPTIVTNYPKEIKSFYMKENDDNKTVAAMDLLVPGIGELIGGSMREDNYDILVSKMTDKMKKDLSWYLDLRRYGTVPHGGFGLGFERLVLLTTGMKNIRDVIPYPRYPKHCQQ